MQWVDEMRPIRLFSLYLALYFLVSTALRWRQYQTVVALALGLRSRWPKLTQLLLGHRHLFLTWRTLLPLILTLVVLLANFLANRLLFPRADHFSVGDLRHIWPMLVLVLAFGACMAALDGYTLSRVGKMNQEETEGYFDTAEKWLTGWRAPVVRWASLGFVNPHRMVDDQVRDALVQVAKLLHTSLWWTVAQTSLRIGFGLSLWAGYALEEWLRRLLMAAPAAGW